MGYRCLTRGPTPVSNEDERGTVKLEPVKSACRAFGRASSGTFLNNQKQQQCKLLEVVSPSWGQENVRKEAMRKGGESRNKKEMECFQ